MTSSRTKARTHVRQIDHMIKQEVKRNHESVLISYIRQELTKVAVEPTRFLGDSVPHLQSLGLTSQRSQS